MAGSTKGKKVRKDLMNTFGGKNGFCILAEVGSHKPGERNKKGTGIAFIRDTPGGEIRIIFIVIEIACDLRQISRRLQENSESFQLRNVAGAKLEEKELVNKPCLKVRVKPAHFSLELLTWLSLLAVFK